MTNSLHDPKNKTQSVFRGWDYSEIIEWMEVDYKDSYFKLVRYRLKNFYFTMRSAFRELFLSKHIDSESREVEVARIALKHLVTKLYHGDAEERQKAKDKVSGIRTYVKRLSEFESSYTTPLWKGLYEIESDTEFIRCVSVLIEMMWD